jgi:sugar-specific transcriptional regulator TrmB
MPLLFLTTLGLTDKEAAIYQLLIQTGELSATTIMKKTGYKRATVYKTLYSLEDKQLVTQRKLHKKIHFRPAPPTKLFEIAEQQAQTQARARDDLRSILPQLTSDYIKAVEKPIVTTYEGLDGLKQIYQDTIDEGATIHAFVKLTQVDPQLRDWLDSPTGYQRVKHGIAARVIVASGQDTKDYVKQDDHALRTTRIVPYQQFPFQHEVDIYGNKVAFINYQADQPMIGIIINHPQIAKTMEAIFNLAWASAESPN